MIRKNTNDKNIDGEHLPILLEESLELLQLNKGQVVIDCTVNRAGHSQEFAREIGKNGTLICIDLDNDALLEAKYILENFAKYNSSEIPNLIFVNDNFANLENILEKLEQENSNSEKFINKIDVIYADLGLSSQELDISGRGFSFLRDEPLLMTFKSQESLTPDDITAEYIVNNWEEETLASIIYNFADEKYSRKIAKAIVDKRENKDIKTTFELVEIIKESVPIYYQKGHLEGRSHFATKTFQALRMAVNSELDNIITLLQSSKKVLKENGKIGIITFHSTEDRTVKKTAKELGFSPINKKVIIAGETELKNNPRSRSAKLRVYQNMSN